MQKWVVAETDARYDMRGTERHLFNLSEILVNGPVKHHFSDDLERNKLLGPKFGSIENIEVEFMFTCFGYYLDSKLPCSGRTILDGLFEVLAMEVCVKE